MSDVEKTSAGRELPPRSEQHATATDMSDGSSASPSDAPTLKQELVEWDGPDDPANPLNFRRPRAWLYVMAISVSAMMITCTSSMISATYEGVMNEFGVSRELATFGGISLFLIGLGISPLFLGPYSERFGRRPIYVISLGLFTTFGSIPVALAPTFAVWAVFRFFSGFLGAAFLSVAGGTVSDLFAPNAVSAPMALYTCSLFVGPTSGPVFGNAIVYHTGDWRDPLYFQLGFSALAFVLVALCPETHAPTLLRKKAARLRRQTGNANLRAQVELNQEPITRALLRSCTVPFKILLTEPMALLIDLWSSLVLGVLYLCFGSFDLIYPPHGFNQQDVGLAFVPIMLGVITAALMQPLFEANARRARAKAGVNALGPEIYLTKGKVGGIAFTIGLVWLAASLDPSVHWIVSMLGLFIFGLGTALVFTSSFTFLVAAYRPVAASAMAGNSVLRSTYAAVFPLFGVQMYQRLGNGWATGLLAFISALFVPLPFYFARIGPRIRKNSKYGNTG